MKNTCGNCARADCRFVGMRIDKCPDWTNTDDRKAKMKHVSVAEFMASRGKKKATRKPKTNARPEAALKRSVVAKLTELGFWCWVNNSGVMVVESKGKRRIIKLSPKGSPDVFVIGANGRLCGIECKAPGKKQSASQIAWEKKAKENGVGYAMAWNVHDAVWSANAWKRGEP